MKYDKSNNYYDWSDKTLQTYKDKEKIEDKIGIIIQFVNEKKLMLRLHLKCTVSAES